MTLCDKICDKVSNWIWSVCDWIDSLKWRAVDRKDRVADWWHDLKTKVRDRYWAVRDWVDDRIEKLRWAREDIYDWCRYTWLAIKWRIVGAWSATQWWAVGAWRWIRDIEMWP